MGKSAYKNTFKSKNTYENILTGINKEVWFTNLMYAEQSLKEKLIKCKLYFRPEKIR